MGMIEHVEDNAIEIVMIIISIVVIGIMAQILPGLIAASGFTGASATIVGLIPMFIPVAVIMACVAKMFGFLNVGGV
jgi:hypothetical protein